jgi:CRISPR-associated endonuclease/helicase Cas3
LPKAEKRIGQWVSDALSVRLSSAELEPVVQEGHGGHPHDFQNKVANAPKRITIVMAGCGNGKTTAAYMWAQKWAVGKKLFFTYPTTGTASAGFQDYLMEQKQVTSALIHGRSLVDLEAMYGTPEDDKLDEWLRVESLHAWNRHVVVCTVDTVLGLIQNQRRPLFSFPAIAAGAFVFDEIHSYDRRLFGELLTFLETFPGAPALLMSASIPPKRLADLRDVLKDRVGCVIRGDPKLEAIKRYALEKRNSTEECWQDVAAALEAEKKVLWVCNTVGSAITLAGEARKRSIGVSPIIYHSRFRYKDRVKRQAQVIAEFAYEKEEGRRHLRHKPGPSLVIATQVCEMSLDISADLMVTPVCPLPSLVQRLGRLNRYAQIDNSWPCLVFPFQGDPYNEEEQHIAIKGDYRESMTATRDVLDKFKNVPCSQEDLAAWLKLMQGSESPDRSSAWLDGGWETQTLPAREGDASITVIQKADFEAIEKKLGRYNKKTWTSKHLVPWTIPMLYDRRFCWEEPVGGYPVAPIGSIRYDEEEGATWQLK